MKYVWRVRRASHSYQLIALGALMEESMNTRRNSQSPQRNSVLILGLLLIAAIAAIVWTRHSSTVAAQGGGETPRLSDEAQSQIRSLLDEKRSRTPAQQKIDSQLLYASRMRRGQDAAPGVRSLQVKVEADADNRVVVDITAVFNSTLIEDLAARGAEIISAYPQYHSVRAAVQLDQLESIAALPAVRFIQPKQEANFFRATEPSSQPSSQLAAHPAAGFSSRAARIRSFLNDALASFAPDIQTGGKTSEGDKTHRADAARAMFGFNGAGVRIGVLSDGVDNLAASQAFGDLPQNVIVLPGQNGSGDEGTAMMEIIHDLAPGAQLYFASAFGGVASFAKNIRDLRAAGCDIIVDDVGYFVESPFHDGQPGNPVSTNNAALITQAVNDATASGALYFSSAGNDGNKNDNTSGTWEGNFTDGGTLPIISGGMLNDFGGSLVNRITTANGPISLFWADPLGGSNNDYDLFILNNTNSMVIASSTNVQNGTQDPFEQITTGLAANNRVVILKKDGAANRFLHLSSNGGQLNINTPGAIRGHSATASAFGVAATPAGTPFGAGSPNPIGPFPNPFNTNNKVELFNSDGPRRIFFNAAGAAITPGNFSATGGLLRQKPDIAAADGVMVTGVGGFPARFFGTSAAAPHAAAIAALLKSANPALTSAQIRTALTSTAIDIETSGVDRDAGAGIVMAFEALQSIGAAPSPNLDLGLVFAAESGGNGNKLIEPGEGASLVVKLLNTGVVNAANVNATLSATTPGVTVTQGSSSYGDLSAPNGMAANATLFGFALDQNAACPRRVDFKLTVTFAGGGSPRVLPFSVETGPPPVTITSLLDSAPPASGPGFTGSSGLQTGRLNRTGDYSSCGIGKTCPGLLPNSPAPRRYDAYTFTSCPASASACVTVTFNTACGASNQLFAAAYAGSFNPDDLCSNYLGDAGGSPIAGGFTTFSFNIPSGSTFTIVVHEVNAGSGAGCSYSLNVGGLCCQMTNACPTFSSFSSPGAGPGNTVAINGSNFTGVTGVRFANNLAAAFNVVSDSQIVATVPAGVLTGPVTISKPGCPDLFTSNFKGDCAYTIAPASQSFMAIGGSGSVNVATTGDCGWSAASNDSFITVNPASGGAGNGAVNFTVAPNTSSSPRLGTITVAGRTFIVTQFGTSGIPPATWVTQNSATTNQLNSVHFTSDTQGWAAGSNATLRRTVDGGANWTTVNTSTAQAAGYNSVRFINQNIGWTGGAMSLLLTLNGGGLFTTTTLPTSNATTVNTPASFFPISDTRVWGAGAGSITTANGVVSGGALFRYGVNSSGATTEALTTVFPNGPAFRDIFFAAPATGFAVGDQGRIARITNAEAVSPSFPTTTVQASGVTQTLNGVHMLDANTAWVAGDGGTILKTVNGGAAWTAQASGVTTNLRDAHFVDANRGWAVGDGGLILATTDGGNFWYPETSGVTADLRSAHSATAAAIYAVGANGVIVKRLNCSYSISAASANIAGDGGAGAVNVTAGAGCNWTAISNDAWITVTGGASGNGNGPVNFSAAANPTANPRAGTIAIAGQTFTVNQAAAPILCPTVSGVNPNSAPAGAMVTISGTNFTGVNSVKFAGNVAASFTVNSDTQIAVTAPNGAITGPITISKTGCADVQTAPFTIIPPNPVPALSSLNPNSAFAGGAGFALTVNGSNFINGSIVRWNNNDRATTFANATQLTATIPASDIASAGTASVTVFSPGPGGGASNALSFNIIQLYEADVAPRPNGDGSTTIADWAQVGRFATGLDTAGAGSEFQRADCAPRDSLGNGAITISDWVQAGRYAAGLDPLTPAGGPAMSSPFTAARTAVNGRPINIDRNELHRVSAFELDSSGHTRRVAISLDARGGENALGFSLLFNPSEWRFVAASAGRDAQGATLNANSNEASSGRIGLAIILPAGQTFESGSREIVILQFTRQFARQSAEDSGAPFAFGFGDQPVSREIVSTDARALPSDFTLATKAARAVATVSAASFAGGEMAPGQIVTAFGEQLAAHAETASSQPLPFEIGGAKVTVTDSAGVPRPAPLFFVSPRQINYLIPIETALGTATVTITNADGAISIGVVSVTDFAPSLFAANSDGQGAAAAVVLRAQADGSRSIEPAAVFDPSRNGFAPAAIDVGADDEVFLILFGTGLNGRQPLANLKAAVGGAEAEVVYAGPQGEFAGLDQINLRLPKSLAGSGEVEVAITINGRRSNAARIRIK